MKCDKVHPVCSNCVKTGDECAYDSNVSAKGTSPGDSTAQRSSISERGSGENGLKRRRRASRAADSDGDHTPRNGWVSDVDADTPDSQRSAKRTAIESRLDRLTSMVEQLSRANGTQMPFETTPAQLREQIELERKLCREGQDPRQVGSAAAAGPTGPTVNADGCVEFPLPSGVGKDPSDPISKLNLGHLSLQDGGRSRYVGGTFFAAIADEISELNQLLRDQNQYHGATTPINQQCQNAPKSNTPPPAVVHGSSEANSFRKESKALSSAKDNYAGGSLDKSILFQMGGLGGKRPENITQSILQHVPTRRQSNTLYRSFITGIHSVIPLFHPPYVLELYEEFWSWYDNRGVAQTPCPNPTFLPLLYAIWYGGSVSIPVKGIRNEFGSHSRATVSAAMHDEVTRCLTLVSFPRVPSLPALMAFLIYQTILGKEEEPLTTSLYVGLALRVAQTMGLHRDPSHFNIEPAEAETRRRVWWHIVYLGMLPYARIH